MIGSILTRAGFRYLFKHPWQTWLSILGITLGVAVVVAVDLANESASRAFVLSMEHLTGRTTHQITAGPQGIPEQFYTGFRVNRGMRNSAPVVEGLVRIRGETFNLLGVDPFAEGSFRAFTGKLADTDLRRLLTTANTILMSGVSARRLAVTKGDRIELVVGGRPVAVEIAGLLFGDDAAAMGSLLVADIATAQELLGRIGRLDRIDLILDDSEITGFAETLPPGLTLVQPGSRTQALARMSEAFRINLSAMSLLALLVGGFLIYNTMTFSVLQRRGLLGTLRILGVSREEIFIHILLEALVVGLIGTALGLLLGLALGQGLLHLVSRTINDLYYVLTVTQLLISPLVLLKGLLLGISVTLLASAGPAMEAVRSRPHLVQRRSIIEGRSHHALPWLTVAGIIGFALGMLIAHTPSRSLNMGFVGLFLIIIGYSLLVPGAVLSMARLLLPPFHRIFGTLGRLAARGISAGLSRTGLAISALVVALSATVGTGIMVESFRANVADWLEQTLRSDIYISAPHGVSSRADGILDPRVMETLRTISGIAEMSYGRGRQVDTAVGPVQLLAIEMASRSHRGFKFKPGVMPDLWPRFHAGEFILVSESYAYHQQVKVGDKSVLFSSEGPKHFTIGGVFSDYGSDRGLLVMARPIYETLWRDPARSSIGIFLQEPAEQAQVLSRIRKSLSTIDQELRIRSNRELRERSLEIFDRTFTITRVLRLLAIAVAFVGVLSALMALELERAREHAVLRAMGVTPGQMARLILLQTGLMGLMAGALSIPLGWIMSKVLIDVINLRSFGWSMDSHVPASVLAEAVLLALFAALLAGLYPGLRMARTPPAEALREE